MRNPGGSFFKAQTLGWMLMILGYIFKENGLHLTSMVIFLIALYFFCKSLFLKTNSRTENTARIFRPKE